MKKVLVVEDHEVNMKLILVLLAQAGYATIEAYTARGGIELAREQHPDLILMDMRLPDMDGLAATQLLKNDAATQDIKIVAFTASAMIGDRERLIAGGCDGYISKPIIIGEFLKVVGEMTAE